jgi:cyclophilin family peptidyl-prolyl cis-trans isomerase
MPRLVRAAAGALGLLMLLTACAASAGATPPCPTAAPTSDESQTILSSAKQAVVATNKGSFTIQLFGDKAPIATANFVALARCGFYSGVTFHRVVAGFIIQAGDPQSKGNHDAFDGLGTGGPGYAFAIETPPADIGYAKYAVVMANRGEPNSNGSQFFIDLADLNDQLPRTYTIFGTVTQGADVVDAIGQVPTNGSPSNTAQNVPLDPVIISSITIRGGS